MTWGTNVRPARSRSSREEPSTRFGPGQVSRNRNRDNCPPPVGIGLAIPQTQQRLDMFLGALRIPTLKNKGFAGIHPCYRGFDPF